MVPVGPTSFKHILAYTVRDLSGKNSDAQVPQDCEEVQLTFLGRVRMDRIGKKHNERILYNNSVRKAKGRLFERLAKKLGLENPENAYFDTTGRRRGRISTIS